MKGAWLAPSAPRDPSCSDPPPGRPPRGGRPLGDPPSGRPPRGGRPLGGPPSGRPPRGGRPSGGPAPLGRPRCGRPLGGPAPPGRPRCGPGSSGTPPGLWPARPPSGPGGLCARAPSPTSWCRCSLGSPLGRVSLALARGLLGYRGSLGFAEHHTPPEKQVRVIWHRLDIIVQIATKFDTMLCHAIGILIVKPRTRQVLTRRSPTSRTRQ